MNMIVRVFEAIIIDENFQKLIEIGGGKRFHNEGNAFVHTMLVFNRACDMFDDYDLQLAALLHDVGKVYTGKQKEDGDWEYPNHSVVGAERLLEFMPDGFDDYPNLEKVRFYVRNHIKPLFWKEYPELNDDNVNLAKLAICDLMGSFAAYVSETFDKIDFLADFIRQAEPDFRVKW